MKGQEKTPAELKNFGLTMAAIFALLAAAVLWRSRACGVKFDVLVGLCAVFMTLALAAPLALRRVEYWWLKLGEVLGRIVSPVILVLTFYVVLTPLALALRFFGGDPLQLRFERERKSYWDAIEKDGPHSRPFLPY